MFAGMERCRFLRRVRDDLESVEVAFESFQDVLKGVWRMSVMSRKFPRAS